MHADATRAEDTDWRLIALLYGELARVSPSPVVELNRAVAVAMATSPERGLELVERIADLETYHLLHAARADMLRRLGRASEAASAYKRGLQLTSNLVERAFLERRLAEMS